MHHISKIVHYLVIIFIILSINFFLPRMMPGDPLAYLTDPSVDMGSGMSEEKRELMLGYYRLDKPLFEQYINYLTGLTSGDLGTSIHLNAPVMKVILGALKWTLLLTMTSTIIYVSLGVFIGAASAWERGGKKDIGLLILIITLSSIPSFFLGILFVIFFALKMKIFPIGGAYTMSVLYSDFFDKIADILYHLVLPVATLVISHLGGTYLLMRNSMLNVLGDDYILTARAKGISEQYILYKHALRNALLPIVTMSALAIGFMITSTIFVESVFAYPGIGLMMYNAVLYHDYPLLQGIFLLMTIGIIGANFIADMIYEVLDPRLRHE
jgi:peptide/nickel transport system permease protein